MAIDDSYLLAVDIAQINPTSTQIDEISNLFNRAFFNDPLTGFILPELSERNRLLKWYPIVIRYGMLYGEIHTADINGNIAGASIWIPPGNYHLSIFRLIRIGILSAPFIFGVKALKKAINAFNYHETLHKKHAPHDHWYLFYIATDPEYQGQGIGDTIMSNMLDRINKEHADCYLETTNPRNPQFYLKYGFDIVDENRISNNGPVCWSMLRKPKHEV